MNTSIVPMKLGDIFDKIFRLIPKTALRNLIIAIIVLLPAAIFFTYGMDFFFSTISQFSLTEETAEATNNEAVFNIFKAVSVYLFSFFFFIISFVAATLGIIIVGCSEMTEQPLSWREAMVRTFSVRLLRVYGQIFLEYLAIGCLFIFPFIFIAAGVGADSVGITLTGVFLLLVVFIFAIYLWVRWAFALPAIAWEDAGIMQSFSRSCLLVNGFWWRTFGILILLNLIAQFAVSMITTPISLIAFWDFFLHYFEMINSIASGAPNSQMPLELFDSFGISFGIVTFISYVLMLLVTPHITTIMYFDLRARNDEFVQPPQDLIEKV